MRQLKNILSFYALAAKSGLVETGESKAKQIDLLPLLLQNDYNAAAKFAI